MIEFHADDYGLFCEESKRIIDCIENGVLNGVSIMPNSPHLEACMEMLKPYKKRVALTVHLNLVEGHCLSRPQDIDLLVDKAGNFNISFGKLLLVSFLPIRAKYMAQLEKELRRQIEAVKPFFEGEPLRLDGHVHYHQLPVVFDSIVKIMEKDDLHISYIRMPRESFRNYRPIRKLSGLKAINFLKVAILNALVARNKKKYKQILKKMDEMDFSGVLCSGNMCYENLEILLQNCGDYDGSADRNMEILFHPGAVLEEADQKQITSKDDMAFLTDEGRMREAVALKRLKAGRTR